MVKFAIAVACGPAVSDFWDFALSPKGVGQVRAELRPYRVIGAVRAADEASARDVWRSRFPWGDQVIVSTNPSLVVTGEERGAWVN